MVAVVVPWRSGCPHREAAWALIRHRLATTFPAWDIVEGRHDDGPWCKAAAVADALHRTDADILVLHDADVWCDGTPDAVAALEAHPWAIPHGQVWRLAEGQLEPSTTQLAQKPYRGLEGGGIVAIRRSTYEACPLDPRFTGWGQEDECFALALRALHRPPWRGDAPLWHWWHPPQPRRDRRTGSNASARLHLRYRQARRNPDRMRALLEEVTG